MSVVALPSQIAVLGAGSWGTALAIQCARAGNAVRLWGRSRHAVRGDGGARRNPRYLPDAAFPDGLDIAHDLASAFGGRR